MPSRLGRLSFFTRRGTRSNAARDGAAAVAPRPIDPDLAPVGPPVLLPTAIIRQVLFEATELIPAWALPHPSPITTAALASAGASGGGGTVEVAPARRTRRASSTDPGTRARRSTKTSASAEPPPAEAAKPRRTRRAKSEA